MSAGGARRRRRTDRDPGRARSTGAARASPSPPASSAWTASASAPSRWPSGLLRAVGGPRPLSRPRSPPSASGCPGFEAARGDDLALVAERVPAARWASSGVAIATRRVTSLLGAIGRPRRRASSPPGPAPRASRAAAIAGRRSTAGARCWATPAAASRSGARGSTPRCAAYDGRGGSRALRQAAEQVLRRSRADARRSSRRRRRRGRGGRRLRDATWPRAAEAGDEAARAILSDAARELARSALRGARARLFDRMSRRSSRTRGTSSGPAS